MRATPFHPSLPPKPQINEQIKPDLLEPSTEPIASTSTSATTTTSNQSKPLCSSCHAQPAKYTCPGCSTRTCSLPCSVSHKSTTGCTGERNKAAYVPMNQYTWGKMMDDYVFLEEVGRKVGDVGNEIVRGGLMAGAGGTDGGRGGGMRGRGRGRGGYNLGNGKTKRDILKMQLDFRDIDIDLLPAGMEKRKANQSTWDTQNQTALLTIQLKFYKPKDPLAPSSEPRPPPFVVITHKNEFKTPLLDLIRLRLQEKDKTSKKDTPAYPEWVKRLVFPDPDDPESFVNPQCVMQAQLDPLIARRTNTKRAHHSLDPTQPLVTLLRQKRFVEYPTIEVWDVFPGVFVDSIGLLRQEEERPLKKRKINQKAGEIAIAGLLGGYGSEDEADEEKKEEPKNMLAALGDYAESDENEGDSTNLAYGEEEEGAEGADMEALNREDEGEVEVDSAVLLELMRAARGGEWTLEADDDDAVDWGDMDDGELE